MLQNTFLHIPYISEATEKKFWDSQIFHWDDFLRNGFSVPNKELIEKYIILSKERLEKKDYEFFSQKLLSKYHWRGYDEFKDNCCFLDIETTGLNKDRNDITTIGVFNGKESKVFINGIDLHKFPEEINKYSFLVTFNGALFDIPFIKAKFPEVNFNQFHVDLRFGLRGLGYSGGLKSIEKQVGISREGDLSDLSGKDAIKLWYRYKRYDDKKALDTLVRYNIEDIENLKTLMELMNSELKKKSILTN